MRKLMSHAWGEFLSRFPWDWFVTLTFREPQPTFRAERMFRRFAIAIEKAAGLPIAWFRVFEYGSRGGRLHLHVLMLNVAHLSRLWWMEEWNRRAGYARILPFDGKRGAAYYCAKYVTKSDGEWEIVGLPASAIQPILALTSVPSKSSNRRQDTPPRSEPPEVTVRRRRPDKLYWHRRDWESEMLSKANRWRG